MTAPAPAHSPARAPGASADPSVAFRSHDHDGCSGAVLRRAEERVEKITLAANGQPAGTTPVEGL